MRPKYKQGKSIDDPTVLGLLSLKLSPSIANELKDDEFCNIYHKWISSNTSNKIVGLDNFLYKAYSQGTTESFDKFYVRHAKRRFRIWQGEYAYHRIMLNSGLDWCWLDDEPVKPNDVVIISIPFADSGNDYRYTETLEQCEALEVPVLVDLCWFGTCYDLTFNLKYSCIQEVVFSLSKTFPVSRLRIGMRYSKRYENYDGLFAYRRDHYLNYHSQTVGMALMLAFSSDYIVDTYKTAQLNLCYELGVKPSNSVCLATGDDSWSHLNRGGTHNRLCLSDDLCNAS